MAVPVFHLEAGFGSRPGDAAYAWTDLTTRGRSASYNRGRNHDFDRTEAGQGHALMKDHDRALDPNYSASPYYPNVIPLVPLRLYAVLAATTYYCFQHYVERWPWRRVTGAKYAERDATTVDGFEILGLQLLQPSKASLTTALGGNRDLTYLAVNPGAGGNNISIKYQAKGALKVTVVNADISVTVPIAGATASAVMAAINAHADASKKVVASLAPGSTGAGLVTTLAATFLSGGKAVKFDAELTGTRVTNVLNTIGWPAALRLIAAGQETVQAVAYKPGGAIPSLQLLQDVAGEGNEEGWFFIDGRGRVVFLDAKTLVTSPYTVSQATFSDTPTGAEIGYVDPITSEDKELIINEITGTRLGGTAKTTVDLTSQAKYLRRTRQISSLLTTDDKMIAKMQARISNYKDPHDRLQAFTVRPGNSTAKWAACLARELGDRVTVKRNPPGGGATDSRDYIIEHLSADIDLADPGKSSFQFDVWPADSRNWLILGNATFGKLDSNKLAA